MHFIMKKTYFKPETTVHSLYMEHCLALSTKEEGVNEASIDEGPTVDEETETPTEADAWGWSNKRGIHGDW